MEREDGFQDFDLLDMASEQFDVESVQPCCETWFLWAMTSEACEAWY